MKSSNLEFAALQQTSKNARHRASLISAAKKAKATHMIICTDVFGGEKIVHVKENLGIMIDQYRRQSHKIEVVDLYPDPVPDVGAVRSTVAARAARKKKLN